MTALTVMTVAATALGVMVADRPAPPQTATAPASGTPAPRSRPAAAPLPNDGWFISPPAGMSMRANEVIEDADMLPLYLDDTLAEAIVASGFQRVRMRSYYAGATGGGAFKVIEVEEPATLLRRLQRAGDGQAMRLPDLPDAHMRRQVVQMESTRAHDVFAHFRTITFLSAPYVVAIEAYALDGDVAQRRARAYARAEHELLQTRPD